MKTNLAHDLRITVSLIQGRASKNTTFDFHGRKFPLKLTKSFLGTFKKGQELLVELDGHKLCFKWKNGHAHINTAE